MAERRMMAARLPSGRRMPPMSLDGARPAMDELGGPDRPCYSMHLVRPFAEAMRRQGGALASALAEIQVSDADDRIPIAIVHQFLEAALEQTGDPDLGLKAAQHLELGDVGALDYLVSSCQTVRDAIEASGR